MFVDTNVLVMARFVTAPFHYRARNNMNHHDETGESLRISRQVIREYLSTVTREQLWANPLAIEDALKDVEQMAIAFGILEDGPRVMEVFSDLCRAVPVQGKKVHDANIAVTMLFHGEKRLLTFNVRDFRRYGQRIELIDAGARTVLYRIPKSMVKVCSVPGAAPPGSREELHLPRFRGQEADSDVH
ncbi:MAG: PIN domain-containing protein [Rhodobacteraceae bacterium]|nr:PIN domain-containing protein [Paracoccaceae bacterium]MCY4141706.1 PIN domain-containing protein [Paracoccaceae bacterium]